jgi:proline-specific peptidase
LLPLIDLHNKYNVPVIFYDQIGCGRSTRLREKNGDETFWTVELFIRELENLVEHLGLRNRGFDFLGHSWGGMLGGAWAARQPAGLRRLILAGAPSSVPLMVKGVRALAQQLPKDVWETIKDCEERQDYSSEKYQAAIMVFYKRHLCRLDPWPKEVLTVLDHVEEDPTVYITM